MIVIHATIHKDMLLLWGEKLALGQDRAPRRTKKGVCHPSACELTELVATANEHLLAKVKIESVPVSAVIALPAVHNAPMLSTDDSGAQGETIANFTVSALALNSAGALQLTARLANLANKKMLAPGVVLGHEFAAVLDLLRLACQVVEAQQFLPIVKAEANNYIAQWQAIFSAAEIEHISALAKSIPAVLRSAVSVDQSLNSKRSMVPSSFSLLQSYVSSLVDALVRQSSASPKAERHKVNIHEAWLVALQSTQSNIVDFDSEECKRFARQLSDWQKPVISLRSAPFRLCFRLDEPAPSSDDEEMAEMADLGIEAVPIDNWLVTYHLQNQNDQSLLVPVEEVWKGSKKTQAILSSGGFNAREHLLLSLGQAAKIYPQIETSLHGNAPSAHSIDNTSAFEFLKEKALLLEDAGFGVLMPSWWQTRKEKLKVVAKAKPLTMKAPAGLGQDTIIEFNFEAALGDQKITLAELTEIAHLKHPLVNLRGQWLYIDADHVEQVLKQWKKQSASTTLRQFIGVALGAW